MYFAALNRGLYARHFESREGHGDEIELVASVVKSTAVKRPRRFSFYLVGYYLMLSGNRGKDV